MDIEDKAHNRAIRMAQKVLRRHADNFGSVEVGYQQYTADPKARAYRQAASELDGLIVEEEVAIDASA